jgi:hypothetical protein
VTHKGHRSWERGDAHLLAGLVPLLIASNRFFANFEAHPATPNDAAFGWPYLYDLANPPRRPAEPVIALWSVSAANRIPSWRAELVQRHGAQGLDPRAQHLERHQKRFPLQHSQPIQG